MVRDSADTTVYSYDANGNRIQVVSPLGTVTGTYDGEDRLQTYGGADYTYNNAGQLTQKDQGGQVTSYTYDVLGNLTAVTLPDSTQISYLVDGQGRRIGKKVNGVLVQGWLWQGQLAPVAELDGSGQVVSRFVYGTRVNVPDYMERGGATYRLVTNHLGSVELVVNASTGEVASWRDYDAWGRVVADSNPDFQPFGFAGGLYDGATGLVRFGARDYDPETGAWTAKDPIGFRGSLNFYIYASGDPVNRRDLDGRCDCWSELGEFALNLGFDLAGAKLIEDAYYGARYAGRISDVAASMWREASALTAEGLEVEAEVFYEASAIANARAAAAVEHYGAALLAEAAAKTYQLSQAPWDKISRLDLGAAYELAKLLPVAGSILTGAELVDCVFFQ